MLGDPIDGDGPEGDAARLDRLIRPAPEPTAEPPPEPSFELPAQPEVEPLPEPSFELPAQPEVEPLPEPSFELPAQPEVEPPPEPSFDLPPQPEVEPLPEPSFELPAQPEVEPPPEPSFDLRVQPVAEPPPEPILLPPIQPAAERAPRSPLDSVQYLIGIRPGEPHLIENDEGDPVLWVKRSESGCRVVVPGAIAAALFAMAIGLDLGLLRGVLLAMSVLLAWTAMAPCLACVFVEHETDERQLELRPEPVPPFWRHRHHLYDSRGQLLVQIWFDLPRTRWICRAPDGRIVCTAPLHPLAALVGLGRPLRSRRIVFTAGDTSEVYGLLFRHPPYLDAQNLLDLSEDVSGALDRRVALALAVLLG